MILFAEKLTTSLASIVSITHLVTGLFLQNLFRIPLQASCPQLTPTDWFPFPTTVLISSYGANLTPVTLTASTEILLPSTSLPYHIPTQASILQSAANMWNLMPSPLQEPTATGRAFLTHGTILPYGRATPYSALLALTMPTLLLTMAHKMILLLITGWNSTASATATTRLKFISVLFRKQPIWLTHPTALTADDLPTSLPQSNQVMETVTGTTKFLLHNFTPTTSATTPILL